MTRWGAIRSHARSKTFSLTLTLKTGETCETYSILSGNADIWSYNRLRTVALGIFPFLFRSAITMTNYPSPTVPEPSIEELEEMVFDSICEATDGCMVEPDGVCPHGYPSWMIQLMVI